jgi:hypothetical protein
LYMETRRPKANFSALSAYFFPTKPDSAGPNSLGSYGGTEADREMKFARSDERRAEAPARFKDNKNESAFAPLCFGKTQNAVKAIEKLQQPEPNTSRY